MCAAQNKVRLFWDNASKGLSKAIQPRHENTTANLGRNDLVGSYEGRSPNKEPAEAGPEVPKGCRLLLDSKGCKQDPFFLAATNRPPAPEALPQASTIPDHAPCFRSTVQLKHHTFGATRRIGCNNKVRGPKPRGPSRGLLRSSEMHRPILDDAPLLHLQCAN